MKSIKMILLIWVFSCTGRDVHDFKLDNEVQGVHVKSQIQEPYKLTLTIEKSQIGKTILLVADSRGLTRELEVTTQDTSFSFDWYDSECLIQHKKNTDRNLIISGIVEFH